MLVGHGGTQHKRVPNVLALARRLVRHLGVGVVALDAPEHGDRVTDIEAAKETRERLASSIASGQAMDRERLKEVAKRLPKHVAEWRALLDDLQTDERYAAGPFGYWGVSMGTHHGVPLVAEEPRISAATFGLFGVGGERDPFRAKAAQVTVPVLFLFQWDDGLMTPPSRPRPLGCLRQHREDDAHQPRWPSRHPGLRDASRRSLLREASPITDDPRATPLAVDVTSGVVGGVSRRR